MCAIGATEDKTVQVQETYKTAMNWKRLFLVGIGWGLGTAVGLTAITGGYLWYQTRPKPPKPWNTTAISSFDGAPGFNARDDGKEIRFGYTLQNSTDGDYKIEPETQIRITARHPDGSFTEPLPDEVATLRRPVFIPPKQKAGIRLSLVFGNIPRKRSNETDEQYHERLRAFCKEELGDVGFALFDERNRYQINLPKVQTEAH